MLRKGARNDLPTFVNEYSTANGLDFVTRLAINPVDSRFLSVLVSIRWEIGRSRRRNSPCRCGLSRSEDKMDTLHLPM